MAASPSSSTFPSPLPPSRSQTPWLARQILAKFLLRSAPGVSSIHRHPNPALVLKEVVANGSLAQLEQLVDYFVGHGLGVYIARDLGPLLYQAGLKGQWEVTHFLLDRYPDEAPKHAPQAAEGAVESGHLAYLKELNQDLRTSYCLHDVSPGLVRTLVFSFHQDLLEWYLQGLKETGPFVLGEALLAVAYQAAKTLNLAAFELGRKFWLESKDERGPQLYLDVAKGAIFGPEPVESGEMAWQRPRNGPLALQSITSNEEALQLLTEFIRELGYLETGQQKKPRRG